MKLLNDWRAPADTDELGLGCKAACRIDYPSLAVSFQLTFIICIILYKTIIFKWCLYLRDECK